MYILVSIQNICIQITAEVSKITKNVPCDLTFSFIDLSEIASSFGKIRLIFKIKNVASFTFLLTMRLHKNAQTCRNISC